VRDARWLYLALLLFFNVSGLWRTSMQLRDLVALGLLEPTHLRIRHLIQAFRLVSFVSCVVAVIAYARHTPFNNVLWLAAAAWTLFGIGYASKGQQVVRSAKPAK
jgi:hypothetical protein